MDTGIVSSRYARALLLMVQENGHGESVFAQARMLLDPSGGIPSVLEPELERLVLVLRRNRREDYLRFVLAAFVRQYCEAENICLAHVTSCIPSGELASRIKDILASGTGKRVLVEETVDPSLIGGFVVEAGDTVLDASVRGRLASVRRQFEQKNKRII